MRKYFILTIGFLAIGACQTELDISAVQQKKRLVVNALLNDQDQVRVWVSQSTNITDSLKPPPLQGADVRITDDAGNTIACSYNAFTEYYESSAVLQSGKTYKIVVRANGLKDASATLQIPQKASSQKSTWRDSTGLDSFGFPVGTIYTHIDDNGAANNYYRLTIFYYDDVTAEWKSLNPPTTDAEIEQDAIETDDGGLIFSDRNFNGRKKEIGFVTQYGFANQTPKFLVLTENLSEEYYRYFKSLDDYRNSGGLFDEPTAIYTNITNGLGIAAGSSMQRDTIK